MLELLHVSSCTTDEKQRASVLLRQGFEVAQDARSNRILINMEASNRHLVVTDVLGMPCPYYPGGNTCNSLKGLALTRVNQRDMSEISFDDLLSVLLGTEPEEGSGRSEGSGTMTYGSDCSSNSGSLLRSSPSAASSSSRLTPDAGALSPAVFSTPSMSSHASCNNVSKLVFAEIPVPSGEPRALQENCAQQNMSLSPLSGAPENAPHLHDPCVLQSVRSHGNPPEMVEAKGQEMDRDHVITQHKAMPRDIKTCARREITIEYRNLSQAAYQDCKPAACQRDDAESPPGCRFCSHDRSRLDTSDAASNLPEASEEWPQVQELGRENDLSCSISRMRQARLERRSDLQRRASSLKRALRLAEYPTTMQCIFPDTGKAASTSSSSSSTCSPSTSQPTSPRCHAPDKHDAPAMSLLSEPRFSYSGLRDRANVRETERSLEDEAEVAKAGIKFLRATAAVRPDHEIGFEEVLPYLLSCGFSQAQCRDILAEMCLSNCSAEEDEEVAAASEGVDKKQSVARASRGDDWEEETDEGDVQDKEVDDKLMVLQIEEPSRKVGAITARTIQETPLKQREQASVASSFEAAPPLRSDDAQMARRQPVSSQAFAFVKPRIGVTASQLAKAVGSDCPTSRGARTFDALTRRASTSSDPHGPSVKVGKCLIRQFPGPDTKQSTCPVSWQRRRYALSKEQAAASGGTQGIDGQGIDGSLPARAPMSGFAFSGNFHLGLMASVLAVALHLVFRADCDAGITQSPRMTAACAWLAMPDELEQGRMPDGGREAEERKGGDSQPVPILKDRRHSGNAGRVGYRVEEVIRVVGSPSWDQHPTVLFSSLRNGTLQTDGIAPRAAGITGGFEGGEEENIDGKDAETERGIHPSKGCGKAIEGKAIDGTGHLAAVAHRTSLRHDPETRHIRLEEGTERKEDEDVETEQQLERESRGKADHCGTNRILETANARQVGTRNSSSSSYSPTTASISAEDNMTVVKLRREVKELGRHLKEARGRAEGLEDRLACLEGSLVEASNDMQWLAGQVRQLLARFEDIDEAFRHDPRRQHLHHRPGHQHAWKEKGGTGLQHDVRASELSAQEPALHRVAPYTHSTLGSSLEHVNSQGTHIPSSANERPGNPPRPLHLSAAMVEAVLQLRHTRAVRRFAAPMETAAIRLHGTNPGRREASEARSREDAGKQVGSWEGDGTTALLTQQPLVAPAPGSDTASGGRGVERSQTGSNRDAGDPACSSHSSPKPSMMIPLMILRLTLMTGVLILLDSVLFA